ncbi:hypothetical protein NliqN6_3951 [Naganishia liquefaciens]|uniref:DUF7729 domain-containing protein n=1 Tax=Naganishia liquefaciens TaxID=104408 RepID=A0A8H3YFE8_9TREE|nr:hypothetical protein NliqN6_3951 [Naganishia liquefaciens]
MVAVKNLFIALAALTTANAQLGGLSGSCLGTLTPYILPGNDLNSCLSLSSLISVFTAQGSIVAPLDSYLNTLCSTTECSNSTLQSAASSIEGSCSSDVGSGNALVTGLQEVVNLYPTIRSVVCLENQQNNTRCITETLYAIQNATNTPLSVDSLTGLLTGSNTTLLNEIGNLNSSVLCTDCTQAMYAQVKQRNASVADGTIGRAIGSKCGANFTSGTIPSGISGGDASASPAASSSAAASSAGGTSGASALAVKGTWVAGVAAVVGVLGGGLVVLL